MSINYWIDKESENNNIVIISSNALFIASADKEHIDDVDQRLKAETSPLEVFGTDGMLVVPHNNIQSIVSRNTDADVEVRYKTKKDIEDKSIYFENIDAKASFIEALSKALPDTLIKKVTQQSTLIAAISPLISLLLGLGIIYFFLNKFRWLAIIIGGLWAIVSAYMLYTRLTNPPEITRWSIKGKHLRKTWSGIKTAFSYVVVAAIAFAIYGRFPDTHGPNSIIQHIYNNELHLEDITKFKQRGADLNARDQHGDTVLYNAMAYGDNELVLELIEQGADVNLALHDDGQMPLEYALYSEDNLDIIRALLEKGASVSIRIDEQSLIDWVRDYNGSEETIKILQEYGAE